MKEIEFIDLLNCSGTGKFTVSPEHNELNASGNVERIPAIYHTVYIKPGFYGKRKVGIFKCNEEIAKVVRESIPFKNKTIIEMTEGETVQGHNKETEQREADKHTELNPLDLTDDQRAKIELVKAVDPKSIAVIVENIEKVCERILTKAKKDAEKPKK
jgi:hypothetical protein